MSKNKIVHPSPVGILCCHRCLCAVIGHFVFFVCACFCTQLPCAVTHTIFSLDSDSFQYVTFDSIGLFILCKHTGGVRTVVRGDGTNEGKAFLFLMNPLPSNKDVLEICHFQFLLEHQLEHRCHRDVQKKNPESCSET